MDGRWEDCLVPSNQQKVYQGESVLTSCGSLPLWKYPGIAPDLSWAGEWVDWKNTQKVSMVQWSWKEVTGGKFRPSTPTNRSLRPWEVGERYAFGKVSQWRGSCSLKTHELPFGKKDTVSLFKKGIREAYEWLTVRVGQHEREFRDTLCIKLRLI